MRGLGGAIRQFLGLGIRGARCRHLRHECRVLLGGRRDHAGNYCLVRVLCELDIKAGLAHTHDVAAAHPGWLRDSDLIDERAVGRTEILHFDLVVRLPHDRMVSRDLAIVLDENVRALAPYRDLAGLHVEASTSKRAVSYDQMGHGKLSLASPFGFQRVDLAATNPWESRTVGQITALRRANLENTDQRGERFHRIRAC